jgi:hypothetical protein
MYFREISKVLGLFVRVITATPLIRDDPCNPMIQIRTLAFDLFLALIRACSSLTTKSCRKASSSGTSSIAGSGNPARTSASASSGC